ncbi:S1 family peptidase [Bradyrhizobium sp. USDA 4473]
MFEVTVKIEAKGASVNGTGFFVGPGLVLTCKHNVVDEKGALLDVVIKKISSDGRFTQQKPIKIEVSERADLALLRMEDLSNRYVVLDDALLYEQSLLGYGFQTSTSQVTLEPIPLIYKGTRVALGQATSKGLCLAAEARLAHELSGSPLVNRQTLAVCGMLYRRLNTGPGGIGCPLEVIFTEFPELQRSSKGRRDWYWQLLVWLARIFSLNFRPRTAFRIAYLGGLGFAALFLLSIISSTYQANRLLFSREGPLGSQPLFDLVNFSPVSYLRARGLEMAQGESEFSNLIFVMRRDGDFVQIAPTPIRRSLRSFREGTPAIAISERDVSYATPNTVQNECRQEAAKRQLEIAAPPFNSIGVLDPPEICRLFVASPPKDIAEATARLRAWRRWKATTFYKAKHAFYYVQAAAGTWYSNNNNFLEPLVSTSVLTGLSIPLEDCQKSLRCVATDLNKLEFVPNGSQISATLPRGEPDVGSELGDGPYLDAQFSVGSSLKALRLAISLRETSLDMGTALQEVQLSDLLEYSSVIGPLATLNREASRTENLRSLLVTNLTGATLFGLVTVWHAFVVFALFAVGDRVWNVRIAHRRAAGDANKPTHT